MTTFNGESMRNLKWVSGFWDVLKTRAVTEQHRAWKLRDTYLRPHAFDALFDMIKVGFKDVLVHSVNTWNGGINRRLLTFLPVFALEDMYFRYLTDTGRG